MQQYVFIWLHLPKDSLNVYTFYCLFWDPNYGSIRESFRFKDEEASPWSFILYFASPQKLVHFFRFKDVKPSPDS